MSYKKRALIVIPCFLLFISGYIAGIAGWCYNAADEHWQSLMYTLGGCAVAAVLLFILFMFSPSAKANNVAGPKSAVLITLVWSLQSTVFAILLNSIIYDRYSTFITVPYATIVIILQCLVFIQFIALSTCTMPSLLQRIAVAWPAAVFSSAILISILLVFVFPLITWVPYGSPIFLIFIVLSIIGLYQTIYTPSSVSDWDYIQINAPNGSGSTETVARSKDIKKTGYSLSNSEKPPRTIRIVQITDPHIGTMMSISRLQKICEQAVEVKPDIVLLTGDFYTVEAYKKDQHALAKGLEPLKALEGKIFACVGNHDLEHCAFERASEDLLTLGVKFLVGEQATVQLNDKTVQIIGLDFYRPGAARTKHIRETMQKFPPDENASLRIVLLHDPGAFSLLPSQNNLVFSGHTHGGQFGLVSLGINFTIVKIAGIPDQGFFEHLSNRLYVHRAHGCRSALGTMMVRLGCPPEFSVLDVAVNGK